MNARMPLRFARQARLFMFVVTLALAGCGVSSTTVGGNEKPPPGEIPTVGSTTGSAVETASPLPQSTSTTDTVVYREPVAAISFGMTGGGVVPPVATEASGRGILYINDYSFAYRIDVKDVRSVQKVTLHLGEKGSNGPTIADISPRARTSEAPITGTLVEGVLHESELAGPMEGKGFPDLRAAALAGRVYVLVQTMEYPEGELRGQYLGDG
ncbi:MAG: CHRD domain-containing protein [Actinobacteria bacterium]|nr:CHRD domain-containing protein [Actinomycetota bacterium]